MSNNEKYTVSSEIRFARNLKEYPFGDRMTDKQRTELRDRVKEAFFSAGRFMKKDYDFIDMDSIEKIHALALAESGKISPEFINSKKGRGLILKKDGSASVMINEEDHIRIRVCEQGLNLKNALEKAREIERLLAEKLGFAYSEKLGYLTTCPANVGTGMRASVVMHLPAIARTGAIGSLIRESDRAGVTVAGADGTGSNPAGSLYRLSNRLTLGVTEAETVERIENAARETAKQEEKILKRLYESQGLRMEDRIMRSYAALKNARLMSYEEFTAHYTNCRIGVEAGILDADLEKLDRLFTECRPASVSSESGKEISSFERDRIRAEKCRRELL